MLVQQISFTRLCVAVLYCSVLHFVKVAVFQQKMKMYVPSCYLLLHARITLSFGLKYIMFPFVMHVNKMNFHIRKTEKYDTTNN